MIPSNSKKTTMVFWGLGWGGGSQTFLSYIWGGGVEYIFPTGLWGGGGSSKRLPTT